MPPAEYPAPQTARPCPPMAIFHGADTSGRPHRPRRRPGPVDLGHRLTGPNAMTSQPRLLTVNIVDRIHPGYFHDTAIDKQPVNGPVELTATGLAGDRQLDPHHGGSDKAVYAYATEDANWWATQLGRTIPPGLFGENLRTQGLDVSGAIIGERWRIGTSCSRCGCPGPLPEPLHAHRYRQLPHPLQHHRPGRRHAQSPRTRPGACRRRSRPTVTVRAKIRRSGAATGTRWSHRSCAQNWPIGRRAASRRRALMADVSKFAGRLAAALVGTCRACCRLAPSGWLGRWSAVGVACWRAQQWPR